jgi:type IX secretion system PorP/SprF family membrane protein
MKIFRLCRKEQNSPVCRLAAVLLVGWSLLVGAGQAHAQADIHFSQFYETSILRNPALTGVFSDDYKIGVYYRNQWSTISHPFETKLVSGEGRVAISEMSNDFFSFGVLGFSDKAGSIDQRITGIYPAVNYNKCMNVDHNSYLSVGFTGGHLQYSFDPSKATFNNQFQGGRFDMNLPSLENIPNAKMSFWDLGAGINYNTSAGDANNVTYVIGVSGYHFTQPKFSYYQVEGVTQNMRFNANAAMGMGVTEDVLVQLQVNAAMQGTYKEIVAGGLVSWTRALTEGKSFTLTGGAFYRYGDAAIPVVRIKYNKLALGVSYDVNVSTLKDASKMNGGFEITLFHSGDFTDKGMAKKMVCPKF